MVETENLNADTKGFVKGFRILHFHPILHIRARINSPNLFTLNIYFFIIIRVGTSKGLIPMGSFFVSGH